jgi:hypothetical protein
MYACLVIFALACPDKKNDLYQQQGIRFRGLTIPECQKRLPKAKVRLLHNMQSNDKHEPHEFSLGQQSFKLFYLPSFNPFAIMVF